MGVDFIQKINETYTKSIDEERVASKTASLFTPDVVHAPCTYTVRLYSGCSLSQGEKCVVTLESDNRVTVSKLVNVIGEFISPPDRLVCALEESACIAGCTVEQVHEITNIVEVSVS